MSSWMTATIAIAAETSINRLKSLARRRLRHSQAKLRSITIADEFRPQAHFAVPSAGSRSDSSLADASHLRTDTDDQRASSP